MIRKTPPMWVKQQEAYEFMKRRGQDGVALFMEMGTGKTRVAIRWLTWLFARGEKLVYVAAPLSVLHVWVQNWWDWAKFPVTFIDLHETGSEGLRIAQLLSDEGYPVICLVNYEKSWQIGYKYVTRTKRNGEEVKEFKKVGLAMNDVAWDVGILDESTAIKNRGSKVSRFFRTKMRGRTKYRTILTGSAYTKRPLDVWAQIMYVCREEVFPPTFEQFAALYAVPHPEFRGQYIAYINLQDLVNRLSKVAVLLKKEDVTDLPPIIHQTRMVSLSQRSRKLYDQISEEMYAEFEALEQAKEQEYAELRSAYETEPDDDTAASIWERMEKLKHTATVTAEHVFSRAIKWQQICSGYIRPDAPDGEPKLRPEPVRLGTEKVSALMEVLEERDGKATVIVVQYDEEEKIVAEALTKAYGVTPKVLNGSVKGAQARHDMIADAANDPFFIVKESVGCRGVDMRWTDCIVFFSHRPDTEEYEQMMSRNHRGGVTELYGWKNITYVHLLVRNSYDMKIMKILNGDLERAREIERNWRSIFEEEDE